MIEFIPMETQTECCIRKAFSVGQLPECHTKKLFPTGESFVVVIAIVSFSTPLKDVIRCKLDQLGKHHLSFVHTEKFAQRKPKSNSNHRRQKTLANEDISRLSKNI